MRITHARILTMERQEFQDGFLRWEGDHIVEIGSMADTADRPGDIDAQGGFLLPGMIDIHTCVGLKEEASRIEGNDFNESSDPLMPHLLALDGFYPGDKAIELARLAGVTAAVTMPGDMDLIGGQAMAIRFGGKTVKDMCFKAACGMKFALGEEPRAAYGAARKAPFTRMGQVALLRNLFREAQGSAATEKQRALRKVLNRELPAYFHAQRMDDIEAALRLSEEFGFKLILVHGADSGILAETLREHNVPVVVGAFVLCNGRMETKNMSPALPRQLEENGVRFAITTDHHQSPLYLLSVSAALATKEGLSVERALEAVTIEPARIAGLDDSIGSLKPGKLADIVLYDGHPFDYHTRARHVWIGGEQCS